MSDYEQQPHVNPYAVHAPTTAPHQDAGFERDDSNDMWNFFGSRASYYVERAARQSSGFNWGAFLFSGLWIAYRKMYKIAAIFFSVMIAIVFIEEMVVAGFMGRENVAKIMDRVSSLIVAIVCGTYGNRWYLNHSNRRIAEIRDQGFDERRTAELLSKRGGTSIGAMLGIVFIFFVVIAVISLAVHLIFHEPELLFSE